MQLALKPDGIFRKFDGGGKGLRTGAPEIDLQAMSQGTLHRR
jgi:hypothetical protein